MRAFAALFLLAACATSAPSRPAQIQNYLAGTSWLRVDDEQANPHGATLEFAADRASGYTGCNRWFATYANNGEALTFGEIGMTRMACVTPMQADTERNFLSALRATKYGHYDQDALVLLDEQQHVIAEFNRN